MELDYEAWIGDAAQIAAMRVRKQKTGRQDAQFLLKLMLEDRFPRVWIPSLEDRDLRQLLWHRHRPVQMRTGILNQLQAVAMNEGMQRRGGLRGAMPKAVGAITTRALGHAKTKGFARSTGSVKRRRRRAQCSRPAGSREAV